MNLTNQNITLTLCFNDGILLIRYPKAVEPSVWGDETFRKSKQCFRIHKPKHLTSKYGKAINKYKIIHSIYVHACEPSRA